MSDQQATTAAANALSGQKTFRTVSFAITGDAETDIIAGVLAVCSNHGGTTPINGQRLAIIMEYLAKRFTLEHQAWNAWMQSFPQAQYQTAQKIQASPIPYGHYPIPQSSSPNSSGSAFGGISGIGGLTADEVLCGLKAGARNSTPDR